MGKGFTDQERNVVIRTYVAEHGGTFFVSTPSRHQKRVRSRIMALVVIAAVGISAGTVQAFKAHQRANAVLMSAP